MTVAAIDLTSIVGNTGGFVIHGVDASDQSGAAVAFAGDVNGDGFDDLVIGAPQADAGSNAKSSAGDSYVVFGKSGGFGTVNLASPGTAGFQIAGHEAGD